MKKHNFKYDYSEGCHPRILELLGESNFIQREAYGEDEYSEQARGFIRQKLENDQADIYFVSGGTQANLLVISSILRPHESVISAHTGHINVHEAGAIEATGHKVTSVYSEGGKLTIENIQKVLNEHHTIPHMVKPKLVYISNSTEIGSIYTKSDLEKLTTFCKQNDLYLYIDGARLGSALSSKDNDLSLADIARLSDIFYIGGTKNGALLGEAIVIIRDNLKEDFAYFIKQKGALLSKGSLLGIQFLALFKDELFFDLADHANRLAMKLANAIQQKGYDFLVEAQTNQLFPILPNSLIEKLQKKFEFYVWAEEKEGFSSIRLVTSWATQEKVVELFIAELE